MQGQEIFAPFFGMLLLTLAVWIYLYVRRISYCKTNNIHAQRLSTPEKAIALIPDDVNYPANNFKNLFELPVVFYALCLYLYVTGNVDSVFVTGAWAFFGLRVLHSAIQCTINNVMLRFLVYMAGALVLWFMVLRAALQL
jgi:hypothetical protein